MPEISKIKPKLSLYDLTPSEMRSFFLSIGEPAYRAEQVLDFLYRHPVSTFDELTTLSKSLRARLSETTRLAPLTLRTTLEAPDGTIKHAYELDRAGDLPVTLESVWMTSGESKEDDSRRTICVSSQLGCAVGCRFCATGAIGLHSQLTAGEIIYQIVHASILYGSFPDTILFMGMGEPMHNFNAVCAAVELLTHKKGLGFSPKRIVISTAGELERLAAFHKRFPRVGIAISLNASTDDLRSYLMPINNTFNLKMISSFISSIDLIRGDRISIEYVLLAGVNDTRSQVNALIRFLLPLSERIKVNLIAYNQVPGLQFSTPKHERVFEIQEMLISQNIMTFIRRNRGRGVNAACGQLGGRF